MLRYAVLAHALANALTMIFAAQVLPVVFTSFWFIVAANLVLIAVLVIVRFNYKRAQNRNMEHITHQTERVI